MKDQKQINETIIITILPNTVCVCLVETPSLAVKVSRDFSALDMLPMRHQMKLRTGKSSFEFLSSWNARNLNLKGN